MANDKKTILYDITGMVDAIYNGMKSEDIVKQFTTALNEAEKTVRQRRAEEAEKLAEEKAKSEVKKREATVAFTFFKKHYPNLVNSIEGPTQFIELLDNLQISINKINAVPDQFLRFFSLI